MEVSITHAGYFINASAIIMCAEAPILATIIGSINRRLLLAACVLWYAIYPDASALMLYLAQALRHQIILDIDNYSLILVDFWQ